MFEELKAAFKDGDPFKSWLPFIAAGVVFLVTTFKYEPQIKHKSESDKP